MPEHRHRPQVKDPPDVLVEARLLPEAVAQRIWWRRGPPAAGRLDQIPGKPASRQRLDIGPPERGVQARAAFEPQERGPFPHHVELSDPPVLQADDHVCSIEGCTILEGPQARRREKRESEAHRAETWSRPSR